MSTASPLPLQPLPPSTVSDAEARAFKQEVASKLAEHRQRRSRSGTESQPSLPLDNMPAPRNRIASSVVARFSKRESYRDFLQHEAEAAMHQAEAEAEVARRTANAVVAAQQQLLDEIEAWNAQSAEERGPADVIAITAVALSAVAPVVEEPVFVAALPVIEAVAAQPAVVPASRLLENLPTEPLEPSVGLPTNLIEFPRQLVAARRARPRLAEGPLREEADAAPARAQLRIFEVEASAVSTVVAVESALPEWHTIRLDTPEPRRDLAPGSEVSFAPPLYVAPRSQRAMATLVDACCVGIGFLMAVATAVSVAPEVPTGLPALIAASVTLGVLWLFYQVLFFSLSNATPGMRYARIGLCTFADENPSRASMLRRIGARLLAGMPFGLGLLWACLDEEGLGWHDRISRMYPRAY